MESSFHDPNEDHSREGQISDAVPGPATNTPVANTQGEQVANGSFPIDDNQEKGLEYSSNSFHSIDPRQITLDRIIGLIVSAILIVSGLIGLAAYYFAIAAPDWIFWMVIGASLLAMLALVVLSVIWPPIEYRHTSWKLLSTGMEIRRGVFWKHQISIPSSRVQHVDVSQGPLQRNFGLATLTIHTAGTSNASVELAGLAFDTATQLRDELVEQREALNVV